MSQSSNYSAYPFLNKNLNLEKERSKSRQFSSLRLNNAQKVLVFLDAKLLRLLNPFLSSELREPLAWWLPKIGMSTIIEKMLEEDWSVKIGPTSS